MRRTELAREDGGYLDAHRTVDQEPAAHVHRLKQPRIRAARANRKKHVAGVAERHGLAGAEIGGEDPERCRHVFEAFGLEHAGEELLHPVAAHESHAAEPPACHVSKSHGTADAGDFLRAGAAGIRSRHDRAGADTGDAVQLDAVAFEDFQDAGVGDATGEPAAKREPDTRRAVRRRGTASNQ